MSRRRSRRRRPRGRSRAGRRRGRSRSACPRPTTIASTHPRRDLLEAVDRPRGSAVRTARSDASGRRTGTSSPPPGTPAGSRSAADRRRPPSSSRTRSRRPRARRARSGSAAAGACGPSACPGGAGAGTTAGLGEPPRRRPFRRAPVPAAIASGGIGRDRSVRLIALGRDFDVVDHAIDGCVAASRSRPRPRRAARRGGNRGPAAARV